MSWAVKSGSSYFKTKEPEEISRLFYHLKKVLLQCVVILLFSFGNVDLVFTE